MLGKLLIALGIVLVIIGVLIVMKVPIPLGRLPGDIRIVRENVVFYFPLTTGVIISALVTAIVWILSKF